MYLVQLRIAPQNPKTPEIQLVYLISDWLIFNKDY